MSDNFLFKLLPPGLFGRDLELAVFTAIYDQMNRTIQIKITDMLRTGYTYFTKNELDKIFSTIYSYFDPIFECKSRGCRPKLYRAGVGDLNILSTILNGLSSNITNNLRSNVCKALTSAINNLVSSRSYNQLFNSYHAVQIIKAHHFTEPRNYSIQLKKVEGYHNLFTVLGACISIIASTRLENKTIELYIIPDGSLDSITRSDTYALLNYYGTPSNNCKTGIDPLNTIIQNLFKLENISFEIGTLTAILIYLSKYNKYIRGISFKELDGFNLVKIDAENRSQIKWVKSLAFSTSLRKLNRSPALVDTLYTAIKAYLKITKNMRSQYGRVIVDTIHALYRYTETNDTVELLSSISDLVRLRDTLERNNLYNYAGIISRLVNDLSRLT